MRLLLFLLPVGLIAQPCQETLNAGDDVILCYPGGDVQLNGSFSGDPNQVISIEWTPPNGLSDPMILDPIASVNTTTTYTLTLQTFSGNNLVVNGDFENGNTGFTSDYLYNPVSLVAEGVYAVTNNPNALHPGFAPCGDHTSGSGQMLAVNGAGTPGQNVWCQTIPVIPNTNYVFSAWVTTLVQASPAILQFYANGAPIGGSFEAPSSNCDWIQFYNIWNSGGASSVNICIVNQNTELGGNDFAIDDIFLSEVCEYEDEVTITVLDEITESQEFEICEGESINVAGQSFSNEGDYEVVIPSFQGCDSTIQVHLDVAFVEAYIDEPLPLDCYAQETQLDGSLSNGSNGIDTWLWTTTNGNIITDPKQPAVSAGSSGTYQLKVSTSLTTITCYDSISVTIPLDTVAPLVSIIDPPFLSCQDSTLQLQAMGMPLPALSSVQWSTPNGAFLSGQDSLNPVILGPGMYIVTLTDIENGCIGIDTTIVQADTSKPVILPQLISHINCRDSLGLIEVAVPTPVMGVTLQWSTSNGIIHGPADTLVLTAGGPGSYTLLATDTLSGCVSNWTTTIAEDVAIPVIQLPTDDTLGCQQFQLDAIASVPSGMDSLSILWSTTNGSFNGPTDSLVAILAGEGLYQVQIENLLNGCRDTASIFVIRNEVLPPVVAGPDLVIDCLQDTLSPVTTGTAIGPNFTYSWSTPSGTILGDTLLNPELLSAGVYVLEVFNTQNLCIDRDTLTVTDIRSQPMANILPAQVLTCTDLQVTLDGQGSDQGHHLYTWTGPDIASGPNTLTPDVQAPGWYTLVVTDTLNHCTGIDSILVGQDITPPQIGVLPPDSLDCNHPTITLDATPSQPAGQISYLWGTSGGNLVSGASSPNPVVSVGGFYTLLLTDLTNGCTSLDSVFVFQDPNLPSASIQEADTLTCLVTSQNLTANYQSPNPNVTFQWTTTNGQIISGANTPQPLIGQPGIYTFVLTDPATGCTATDQVVVEQNITVPVVSIPDPGLLTCVITQLDLIAVPDNYPGVLTYTWSTTNGTINGPSAGSPVQITSPGAYALVWTVPENGCTGSTAISIGENIQPPMANAGPDRLLPCDPPQVALDGSMSTGQGALDYSWTSPSGGILSGASAPLAEAGNPGTYILIVTDLVNGCTHTDTTLVEQVLPSGLDLELDPPGCRRSQGELVLIGSAGGSPPYTFSIDSISGVFGQGEGLLLDPGTWPIQVIDALGCSFDTVIVMPDRQDLSLQVPQEVWVSYGDSGLIELTINFPGTDVDTVLWNPNIWLTATQDPLVWYTHAPLATQYQVTVETTDGCEAKGVIQVLIDNDPVLFVPNVFSPNSEDGVNDRFFPFSRPGTVKRIVSMGIYDRWGTRLFYNEDFPPDDEAYGWDGSFRHTRLNPAVFVWVIQAELNTGEIILIKGDVTLL
ncbi:MAG: gliding motility-associated C-terminal domain-containing protein [Lewinellaceae bacterium]|nr:gliding motility-associated C-terminal domain-containing protein [Saprospiraceae bacterium]MCB9312697.1 gliding motility-associated C-terminal domain-containing protein [Lewinellaceae bacterium]